MKIINRIKPVNFLFVFILLIGIFVRIYEYGIIPPGLNQDEASIGVDAYYLLHFGVDHNGESFPVHTISFGSGQNTAYLYLTIPFIFAGGLNPFTVRLPMLIMGIFTVPLIFLVGRKTSGDTFGLISMFFIAVSPWHIMLSRWGLDSNMLPFLFLVGYICLLKSSLTNYWFVIAGIFFGFCVYAYGSAYFVVPLMMIGASLILYFSKRLKLVTLLFGWLILGVTAAPMLLFVIINTFKLDTFHIGFMTIPRLPSEPRFESMAAVFKSNFLHTIKLNLQNTLRLLWTQTDGLSWNTLDPYGYFYRFTFPLAVVGVISLLLFHNAENKIEKLLLLMWLICAFLIGVLETVNINRINILLLPLIISMGLPLLWLKGRLKLFIWVPLVILLIGFAAFTRDYFSDQHKQELDGPYFAGLLPAITSIYQVKNTPICITNKINMPYIFVLFIDHIPPNEFLRTVKYANPTAPFRIVTSFERYSFGLENCPSDTKTIFLLEDETPPNKNINYTKENFGSFTVYTP